MVLFLYLLYNKIYIYEDKKWKFIFEEIEYAIKWGVRSNGKTDVPNANENPFPNGFGMPVNSTQTQRKTNAKNNLTPVLNSLDEWKPSFTHYWSKEITGRHEKFHNSHWLEKYKVEMAKAETFIEAETVTVTANNLNPTSVLDDEKNDFDNKIFDYTEDAVWAYWLDDPEIKACDHVKGDFQSLANSINP